MHHCAWSTCFDAAPEVLLEVIQVSFLAKSGGIFDHSECHEKNEDQLMSFLKCHTDMNCKSVLRFCLNGRMGVVFSPQVLVARIENSILQEEWSVAKQTFKKLRNLCWKFIKKIMEKFLGNFGKFLCPWRFLKTFWQTSYFLLENSRETRKFLKKCWQTSYFLLENSRETRKWFLIRL